MTKVEMAQIIVGVLFNLKEKLPVTHSEIVKTAKKKKNHLENLMGMAENAYNSNPTGYHVKWF